MSLNSKKRWIYSLAFCSALTFVNGVSFAADPTSAGSPGTPSTGTNQPAGTPASTPAGTPANAPAGTPASTPAEPSAQPAAGSERSVYIAQLTPLNSEQGASNPVGGLVRFVVDGENLGVDLQASGLAPGVMHEQHIYSGTACPTTAADANKDGFIDAMEAATVTGKAVFPFSLNIAQIASSAGASGGQEFSAQAKGKFPMASSDGSVSFITSVPVAAVAQALKAQSEGSSTPSSSTPSGSPSSSAPAGSAPSATGASPEGAGGAPAGAAGTSGKLDLEKHVIQIHGVDPKTQLPSSVQAAGGESANADLPVACGVIMKVSQ